jgi:hypothetical protein
VSALEGEDPSLSILDAIDEEFHRKTMVAPKDQTYEGIVELEKLH